ncbi:helix-turn-helix domain-containing protein [Cytophagaceae bacterium DM2B3-1]|uniref:Helix-turn-helix domain-containing protein n=1 Tax=Xanthocytophaga flava TaxID=3048013 RepID=A0ABT7D2I4_9BACT|nr:helix-turn-helix domain-containing protein [Xanthocytophaga flavus]MDJ1498984.1 helix-turn-helix domain-containing protein [Xanthocytophaga flavus]MDJ1498997.1 helix-turn-helix domain-containing protein [Xanthocytophaga flavus]
MFNPFEELQAQLVRMESILVRLQSIIPFLQDQEQSLIGGIELAMQTTGLAKSTIYNLVSSGNIPHMKRGKKLYFSRKELEGWIQDDKHKTLQELEVEIVRVETDRFLTKTAKASH